MLSAETSGGGALSHSDTVFISPDLPSGMIAITSVIPDTITANGQSLSSITTGQVIDAYGNVVHERTLITVAVASGTIDSDDMDDIVFKTVAGVDQMHVPISGQGDGNNTAIRGDVRGGYYKTYGVFIVKRFDSQGIIWNLVNV